MDEAGAAAFIRGNTRLMSPPLTSEIVLHLATESLPIWQKTEDELGLANVPPPFWAFAWAGGQALARYVLDQPALVRDKQVLDLGSGSGLVAIAAALAGASRVTAVDTDPIAAAAIGLNALTNEVAVTVDKREILGGAVPSCQVLLVGDLFYERGLAARVLALLEAAAAAGVAVLAGDPRRSYFPTQRFVEVATYGVPVTRELEDAEIKCTSVWRLERSLDRSQGR